MSTPTADGAVTVRGRPAPYRIRFSARARRAALHLHPRRGIEVVLPAGSPRRLASELLQEKAAWLERHAADVHRARRSPPLRTGARLPFRGHWLFLVLCAASRPRVALDAALTDSADPEPAPSLSREPVEERTPPRSPRSATLGASGHQRSAHPDKLRARANEAAPPLHRSPMERGTGGEVPTRVALGIDAALDHTESVRPDLSFPPGKEPVVGRAALLIEPSAQAHSARHGLSALERSDGLFAPARTITVDAPAPDDETAVRAQLERWYRARARAIVPARVAALHRAADGPIARVHIRDQESCWGSCSDAGALSFNWRLVMAPPPVLDAIVAHELVHLRVPDHSERFWSALDARMPRHRACRRWLDANAYRLGL